jgi:hypothetical protein
VFPAGFANARYGDPLLMYTQEENTLTFNIHEGTVSLVRRFPADLSPITADIYRRPLTALLLWWTTFNSHTMISGFSVFAHCAR